MNWWYQILAHEFIKASKSPYYLSPTIFTALTIWTQDPTSFHLSKSPLNLVGQTDVDACKWHLQPGEKHFKLQWEARIYCPSGRIVTITSPWWARLLLSKLTSAIVPLVVVVKGYSIFMASKITRVCPFSTLSPALHFTSQTFAVKAAVSSSRFLEAPFIPFPSFEFSLCAWKSGQLTLAQSDSLQGCSAY